MKVLALELPRSRRLANTTIAANTARRHDAFTMPAQLVADRSASASSEL